MKKIEVKGIPVMYLTHSWFMPVFFIVLVVAELLTNQTLSYGNLFTAIIWSLVVFQCRYSAETNHDNSGFTLDFESGDLVCRHKNSVFWHIPYKRLSHIAAEPANTSSWFRSKQSSILIYTKDVDSYSFPMQINSEQHEEIRAAINNLAS